MASHTEETRDSLAGMRVTPSEYLRIGRAASAEGRTISSFCRRIILDHLDRIENVDTHSRKVEP